MKEKREERRILMNKVRVGGMFGGGGILGGLMESMGDTSKGKRKRIRKRRRRLNNLCWVVRTTCCWVP